jgi:hypothetical protein
MALTVMPYFPLRDFVVPSVALKVSVELPDVGFGLIEQDMNFPPKLQVDLTDPHAGFN